MNSFSSLPRHMFESDGTTDWKSKGIVLWRSLITSSIIQMEGCRNRRFGLGERESITISVLINLAASVEAFTKEVLFHHLSSDPEIIKSSTEIKSYLLSLVENYPYNNLQSLFPTLTGSKFSEVISCSRDISILMKLRNRLVHGQPPRILYNKVTGEYIYYDRYKDICTYLYDKVEIPKIDSSSGYHLEFLCFNVVYHFFEVLIEYMNSINTIIPSEGIRIQIKEVTVDINKLILKVD